LREHQKKRELQEPGEDRFDSDISVTVARPHFEGRLTKECQQELTRGVGARLLARDIAVEPASVGNRLITDEAESVTQCRDQTAVTNN